VCPVIVATAASNGTYTHDTSTWTRGYSVHLQLNQQPAQQHVTPTAAPTACLLNSTTSLSYAGGAQRQDFHFTTHLVTVIVTDTAGHPVQGRTITAYNPDDDAITTSDGTIGFTLVKNYQQSQQHH